MNQFISASTTPPAPAVDAAPVADLLSRLMQESTCVEKDPWDFGVTLRKLPSLPQVQALSPAGRLALALRAGQLYKDNEPHRKRASPTPYTGSAVEMQLLDWLLKLPAEHEPAAYIQLLHSYLPTVKETQYWNAFRFPVEATLSRLQEQVTRHGLAPELATALRELAAAPAFLATYHTNALINALRQIRRLLAHDFLRDAALAFSQEDSFGQLLTGFAATDAARGYVPLLKLWQQADISKPTIKFGKLTSQYVRAIGPAAFAAQATEWLGFLLRKQLDDRSHAITYGHHHYGLDDAVYLDESNLNIAKGLVWSLLSLDTLPDAALLPVADLAAKCYRKVPGIGPWCLSLGNACVWTLSQTGLAGAAHLVHLRAKTTNRTIQRLLDKRLAGLAAELRLTPADLEDLAIPTHGLRQGRRRFDLDDYYADLILAEPTKAGLYWFKATGTPLKSLPAALKKTHPAEVKVLQKLLAHVQQTISSQRERLERTFLTDRTWRYERFAECYLHHELLGPMTQALIWQLTLPNGQQHEALWRHESWQTVDEQILTPIDPAAHVRLWHPVRSSAGTVLAWRALLEKWQLRQPFKQAYREVYLLTPPEERTRTYSNRMAAHILKQHQFSALAKSRGWQHRLMGGFDHGSYGAALELPAHHLRAQFWLLEVENDTTLTDSGIYRYIATDQVRFTERDGEAVPLPEIPPVVFSEVMRDVDLFVGVASVGNDPQWRDNGGLAQYRSYWESYSFGELGEVAKNRKLALERLVPRLKIGKVSEIKDKFLVVRGKVRTYKIHLGSGNILMEPNDQYLCIVPDRSAKPVGAPDVFLPFEGDGVLSIILSKAQLLMDDDQITDETILRQIGQ